MFKQFLVSLFRLAAIAAVVQTIVFYHNLSLHAQLNDLNTKIENRLPPSSGGNDHGEVVQLLREQKRLLDQQAQLVVRRPASFSEFATTAGVRIATDRCLRATGGFTGAQSEVEKMITTCFDGDPGLNGFGGFAAALMTGYLNTNELALVSSISDCGLACRDRWIDAARKQVAKAMLDPAQVEEFGRRFTPDIVAEINQATPEAREAMVVMLNDGVLLSLTQKVTPTIQTARNEYYAAERRVCASCSKTRQKTL